MLQLSVLRNCALPINEITWGTVCGTVEQRYAKVGSFAIRVTTSLLYAGKIRSISIAYSLTAAERVGSVVCATALKVGLARSHRVVPAVDLAGCDVKSSAFRAVIHGIAKSPSDSGGRHTNKQ
jgi:hypothetical protein